MKGKNVRKDRIFFVINSIIISLVLLFGINGCGLKSSHTNNVDSLTLDSLSDSLLLYLHNRGVIDRERASDYIIYQFYKCGQEGYDVIALYQDSLMLRSANGKIYLDTCSQEQFNALDSWVKPAYLILKQFDRLGVRYSQYVQFDTIGFPILHMKTGKEYAILTLEEYTHNIANISVSTCSSFNPSWFDNPYQTVKEMLEANEIKPLFTDNR
jgi:hypothetical protein